MYISTRNPKDVEHVRDEIIKFFEASMSEETLVIPYDQGRMIGEIRQVARVLSETNDEAGTHMHIRAHSEIIAGLKKNLTQKKK